MSEVAKACAYILRTSLNETFRINILNNLGVTNSTDAEINLLRRLKEKQDCFLTERLQFIPVNDEVTRYSSTVVEKARVSAVQDSLSLQTDQVVQSSKRAPFTNTIQIVIEPETKDTKVYATSYNRSVAVGQPVQDSSGMAILDQEWPKRINDDQRARTSSKEELASQSVLRPDILALNVCHKTDILDVVQHPVQNEGYNKSSDLSGDWTEEDLNFASEKNQARPKSSACGRELPEETTKQYMNIYLKEEGVPGQEWPDDDQGARTSSREELASQLVLRPEILALNVYHKTDILDVVQHPVQDVTGIELSDQLWPDDDLGEWSSRGDELASQSVLQPELTDTNMWTVTHNSSDGIQQSIQIHLEQNEDDNKMSNLNDDWTEEDLTFASERYQAVTKNPAELPEESTSQHMDKHLRKEDDTQKEFPGQEWEVDDLGVWTLNGEQLASQSKPTDPNAWAEANISSAGVQQTMEFQEQIDEDFQDLEKWT